jgi:dTDP-L-rhamnose 4-epimerase
MTLVLVTGGAGFIGSHTVDALLTRGYDVRVVDALMPPVHDGSIPSYLPKEVDFIRGDVRDRDIMRKALEGVSIVYHMAAYQDYLPDFSTFFTINAGSAALLYELIVANRGKVELIVMASSQAVYGEGRHRCPEHGSMYPAPRSTKQLDRREWEHHCFKCGAMLEPELTPENIMNPHNAYAFSKRDQDAIARTFGIRYDIPSVALRYSIVQGPRQSFKNAYSGAMRAFAVCALNGAAPACFEDGQQLRDYVSIHDVVTANLMPLDTPAMYGRAFNVGGNRRVSVLALASEIVNQAGIKVEPILPGLYRLGDTRHIFSDTSALGEFGWSPKVSQRAIITEYLEWAAVQPGLRNTYAEAEWKMQKLGVLRRVNP